MKSYTIPVVIESDAEGYVASCPTIQGCYTQGATYEEVARNIKEAATLCLEDIMARGEPAPFQNESSVLLSSVEVAV